jgi:hypothetical protein
MPKMIYRVIILFAVFAISCGTNSKTPRQPRKSKLQITMESWVGHSKAEIINSWGPPTSTYNMGDGNLILTWENTWQTGGGSTYYDYFGRQQYNAPQYSKCKKSIYINSSGIIYSWRYEGC